MTTIAEILADLPRLRAQTAPAEVALSCLGRLTTYGELDERSSRVANGLVAAGCQPAARIAYLGRNSDCYFEIVLGAAKARVATVAVNWRLAPPVASDCRFPGRWSSVRPSRSVALAPPQEIPQQSLPSPCCLRERRSVPRTSVPRHRPDDGPWPSRAGAAAVPVVIRSGPGCTSLILV